MPLPPETPPADLPGLSPRETEALALAGFQSLRNLLDHFPRRHEDRRRFDPFPLQPGSAPICLRGRVLDTQRRRFGSGGYYEAIVEEENGLGMARLSCRWFNMPFMVKVIASGQDLILYGQPKDQNGVLVMNHPEFEVVPEDSIDSVHLERLVPIYPKISGLTQRRLREVIHLALAETDPAQLRPAIEVDPSYPESEAYQELHFPAETSQTEAARRHFALQEFTAHQLKMLTLREKNRRSPGRVLGKKTTLLKAFHASLPFELTDAQKRSVKEILADLRAPHPMNRLLQGDVGSGKTFVALCAILLALDSGVQTALMAPTQILAEQHFITFNKWLDPLGIPIRLLTADRSETSLPGEARITIGTHALLFDKADFQDLGLVVIDEQHKFGVTQRARLLAKSTGLPPDLLVMTATPIPRTLTLSLYGDLDLSILDELPAGRGKVITAVRPKPKIPDLKKFLLRELEKGRQAYLVHPLVEDSEKVSAASVLTEFPKWKKRLAPHATALLHGKMNAGEKESVMESFRAGETKTLVATTVIEVGVDVPNATVMVIFNAERFGLAQLHQLRGRIGRGFHKSYCILVTDGKNPEALEKLNILASTLDGFKIAEEDLALRGPGELLGTLQSGTASFRFPEFLTDSKLIHQAREIATAILENSSPNQ